MTTQDALIALTNFGDLAVLLPVMLVVLLWLIRARRKRDALRWVVAVGICMSGTALLKVAFFVCPPIDTLRSPSGHTASSALVYGGLALFVAEKAKGWRRTATILAAVALVGAIAVSRILLNSHTEIETVLGLSIGLTALAVLAVRYLPNRGADLQLRTLMLAAALTVALFHGRQLRAEGLFQAMGIELQSEGLACE